MENSSVVSNEIDEPGELEAVDCVSQQINSLGHPGSALKYRQKSSPISERVRGESFAK